MPNEVAWEDMVPEWMPTTVWKVGTQEYHGPLPTFGWPFGPVQALPEEEYHGPGST